MQTPRNSNTGRVNQLARRIRRCLTIGTRSILVASLLTTGVLSATKLVGLLEPIELAAFDHLTRLQKDIAPDPRILIVGMTEADIQHHGWPLSDRTLAQLLAKLQRYQPRVVGLDLYRSALRPPGETELTAQLKAQNLIAIMNVGSDPNQGEVPPPAAVPRDRIGFNDLVIDPDGILRRSLLYVRNRDHPFYSFALRILLRSLNLQDSQLQAGDRTLNIGSLQVPVLKPGSGGYQMIDASGYQTLLRYRSRQMPSRWVSFSQVLSDRIDPTWVRDRIVLIGTIAPSLKDQFYTPFSASQTTEFTMSGVVIHAQIVSQLLDLAAGQPALYQFWPQAGEALWLWLWALTAGSLAWFLKRPVFVFCAGGLLLLGLSGIGWFAMSRLLWIPLAEPMVGAVMAGGLVIAQKSLYRSTHDSLTELPGREIFLQQVQRSLQSSRSSPETQPVVVAFLDVDRFKLINQSMGHRAGDRALITVSERLRQVTPRSVQLARVGGDEFALLFHHLPWETIEQILNNIQTALAEPFHLNKQQIAITASLGIAITQDRYNHKAEDLMRDAHTAMYRAKALGRFRYEVFAEGMLDEAVNRLRLENDLRNALDKHELTLYYQPIVSLKTNQIVGFEALVRWRQDATFIPPSEFIPIAEETGLILTLGQWILQEACLQLKAWQQQFPHIPLKMSINISKRQFEQSDLVPQIESILRAVDIPGQCLRLEITESDVMVDVNMAIALMLRLKNLGLQLSIDDFGTGYSSLSYLHRFPIDTLKVDKSFVGRMEQSSEDWEIVQTVIDLGHKLGMEVVAEGIETSTQMSLLQQHNCDYGQGYLFSVPLSSREATALLENLEGSHVRGTA